MRTERSLAELFVVDPERAEALTWGRRGALKGASLAALGAALGAAMPFGSRMPGGLLPAALAQPAGDAPVLRMDGKAPLLLLGERPLV
ncbi:MAG: molybdopterin containing oxidoreductase, partial [Acetobacteraceae bacterium]